MSLLTTRSLALVFSVTALLPFDAMASAFQLWEQDGGSVGNYHAGYAALAQDASTAFYNPAGMSRIHHTQIVGGGSLVLPSFKYKGSVSVANQLPFPYPATEYPNVTAKGGDPTFIPAFHYLTPINDRMTFGLSVVAPFGLETDYSDRTPVRYAATKSSIIVVNVAPALSYKLNDKVAIGAGLDVQRVFAELNAVGTSVLTPGSDSSSTNKARGTGYGFHLGGLYEFTPETRMGWSYHSQVKHHLTGSSVLHGPLADALNEGDLVSRQAKTDLTLPAYTALSLFHQYDSRLSLMGSLIYTQWNVLKNLELKNVAGAIPDPDSIILPSTTINAVIPEHYRNTWNATVGADYKLTDKVTLRGGLGYDQTPSRKAYRNVQLPDNNRYVLALGTHIQATQTVGIDLGYSHYIMKKTRISPPDQVVGAQTVSTHGYVRGAAEVFGAQVVWDIL